MLSTIHCKIHNYYQVLCIEYRVQQKKVTPGIFVDSSETAWNFHVLHIINFISPHLLAEMKIISINFGYFHVLHFQSTSRPSLRNLRSSNYKHSK